MYHFLLGNAGGKILSLSVMGECNPAKGEYTYFIQKQRKAK